MANAKLEKYLKFLNATRLVMEFYYDAEKVHFEESEKKKNHIFKQLELIKEFLTVKTQQR